ncbi:hypothetical protein RUND412_000550 [Rhizina undulata]
MRLPRQAAVAPSAPDSLDGSGNNNDNDMNARQQEQAAVQGNALIVAVVFVGVLIFSLLFYLLLRYYRRQHPEPPNFFPKAFHKRWANWQPGMYTSAAQSPPQVRTSRPPRARRAPVRQPIDRNTSIRSIMTLPEYRPVASPGIERTIAREGERGGVDLVVEFPETEAEEEYRREEHMQALYEIRLARQLERATERERNAANAAAAARGGSTTNASRSANHSPARSSNSLIASLAAAQEEQRRQSQVSYAEIGYVRHDGSRVRDSIDTTHEREQSRDSLPLLAGGAPMGLSSHGRTNSAVSFGSSMGTPERRRSEEIFNPASARGSVDASVRIVPRSAGGDIPGLPQYEGQDWGPPPEYESPIETRNTGPNLLPALRIETAAERAESRAGSRAGSRVGSRAGSRAGSRSTSRDGR